MTIIMERFVKMKPEASKVNSSIAIAQHDSTYPRREILEIIEHFFPSDESESINMELHDYRKLMLLTQNELNAENAGQKIVQAIFPALSAYLNSDEILVQSNVYLRASRPSKFLDQESIGWHRETFYGANMDKAFNIWTPIKGVNKENTLQYVPESHLIPENEIIIKQQDDKNTQQFSDGHKLGFQYKPKRIVGGVDFSSKKRMEVPINSSAIFSGNLIHGAAENYSSNIRFSIDFRIIKKVDYSLENKQFHISSGKPYFEQFTPEATSWDR